MDAGLVLCWITSSSVRRTTPAGRTTRSSSLSTLGHSQVRTKLTANRKLTRSKEASGNLTMLDALVDVMSSGLRTSILDHALVDIDPHQRHLRIGLGGF